MQTCSHEIFLLHNKKCSCTKAILYLSGFFMLHLCATSQNEYTRAYPRSSEYKYDNERTATIVVGAFHVAAWRSGISCARISAFSSAYTEGTREG